MARAVGREISGLAPPRLAALRLLPIGVNSTGPGPRSLRERARASAPHCIPSMPLRSGDLRKVTGRLTRPLNRPDDPMTTFPLYRLEKESGHLR
jgi:hypothetical protein